MASKKTGRAAGLAALAGLAYMASRDKGGKEAPSDSSYDTLESKRMPAKQEVATDSGDFLSRRLKTNPETGEAYSMDNLSPMSSSPKAVGTTRTAPASSTKMPAGAFRGMRSDMKSPTTGPDGGNRSMRSDMKNVGGGRSGGRGGAEAGEEAAYRAKAPAVPAQGGNRSTRADMQNVGSGTPGANRSIRSDVSSSSRGEDGGNRSTRSDMPLSGLGGVRRPGTNVNYENEETSDMSMKRGGKVKKMASGGMTSSASKRGDGIASKGKTRCKMY